MSPVRWASFAQRPHKFIDWFHCRFGGEVLWLDPYPGRLPRMGDFKRSAVQQEPHRSVFPSWLRVMSVGAAPIEPIPLLGELNRWLWRDVVAKVSDFVGEERTLIVVGKPSKLAVEVIGKCAGERVETLYDAMDDFPMFYSGLSRWMMGRRESEVVERSDRVWCSSHELYKRIGAMRSDVVLVPNALDRATITGSRGGMESDRSKRKVFGYVGTIGAWFDWQWIITLARRFPQDEIRLIGPIHASRPRSLPPNVNLLPPCDQSTAIEKMRAFDVGLIPFFANELTASVDPVKYYEYRGVGLPVVSTCFGEMSHRDAEPGVFLSHTHDDIHVVIEKALSYLDDHDRVAAFCEVNDWSRRFDEAWASSSLFQE